MGNGISGLLEQLVLPPGGFIFLSMGGLVLMRHFRRVGLCLASGGLILLYMASLPVIASLLLSWIEPDTSLPADPSTDSVKILAQTGKQAQAIVILAGGRHYDSPEFGGDTPSALTVERIRYGVWLAKRTRLPMLVSGGLGDDKRRSEADLMQHLIESEYELPVRWVEGKSHNTHENAKYSTEILRADGIESIYLVTHAAHMKRSLASFEKFGLTIHPAPTAFGGTGNTGIDARSFLPTARALHRTAYFFHEWVGLIWYRLRY